MLIIQLLDDSLFVGRPFYLDYEKAQILVSDAWKHRVKGIPQGTFLLAFYDGEDGVEEAILLRALSPSKLPTDNDVVSSMIEYYKQGTDISGRAGSNSKSKLDDFTRYEFSFSGLECRVLGAFYKFNQQTEFGADLENFYSANNYSVYKATGDVLQKIVNQRDSDIIAGNENEFKIGFVRYSSSRRFQSNEPNVEVFISPQDFVGKSPFTKEGAPQYPVGQIIFDVNGEYANSNMQDEGTAIYELYSDNVDRYSIVDKTDKGFKVLKINFYNEIQAGFKLITTGLSDQTSTYIKSFCSIDLTEPENYRKPPNQKTSDERHTAIAYDKKIALYKCCLHEAGFKPPPGGDHVKFYGDAKAINKIVDNISPHQGITIEQAIYWFKEVYDAMDDAEHKNKFDAYKKDKEKDFFDEDMLALLVFLTRKPNPGKQASYSGFRLLRQFISLHTNLSNTSFEQEILKK